jgi:TolB-like protein
MSGPSLINRLKASRLVQVLLLYLGASWVIIEVAGELQESLALPDWLVPVALVLLMVGLLVVLATAWVQSHPLTDAREAAGEVPDSWEVGVGDLMGAIRRGKLPHLTWGRAILGGVFALSLLFGIAGAYVLLRGGSGLRNFDELSAEEAGAGLAIVPWSVSGVDAEVYREGMITLLSMTLDGVAGLRAVDSRTVLARWDEVVSDDQRPDLAEILEVARRTGARYLLAGSAVGAGSRVQLVGDIYDAASGDKLGTARAEGLPDSLTALVDEFSVGAIRVLLAGDDAGARVQHLSSLTTPSLDALLAYVEGEQAYRTGSWEAALGAYERAIEHDSTFALAHLRAAQVLGWTETGSPVIGRHQDAAGRFSDRLPARERALLAALVGVRVSDAGQIEEAEDAVRRYPDDPDLWNALGELQFHVGQKAMRPVEEELEALERAAELAPDFAPYVIHITEHQLAYGDSAAAAAAIERERALVIDTSATRFPRDHREAFALIHGDSAERAEALAYVEDRGAPGYLVSPLRGLQRLEAQEALWRVLYESQRQNPRYANEYIWALIHRGRVRAALAEFPRDRPWGAQARGALVSLGVFEVDSLRGLNWGPANANRAFAAAALGDSAQFAEARAAFAAELDALYERQPELADDPTGPRWAVALLDAIALWKRRGAEAAEQPLLDAYGHIPGSVAEYVLWELGKLYEELGDERQAFERYRAAAQSIPYAALRAARLADRLGETEEARRLYREVLIAWEDADPSFDPWLEEARGWLERLPG